MEREDADFSVTCSVNGRDIELVGSPVDPASGSLRAARLFSVRETCALGICGTCTVLLDDEPVSTCLLPLYALDGRRVDTAEGLADGGQLNPLQEQFVESQAFQCSFCTPGFLMSGVALLRATPGELTDDAVTEGLQGHLCRCGCYQTIKEAVRICASRRVAPGA